MRVYTLDNCVTIEDQNLSHAKVIMISELQAEIHKLQKQVKPPYKDWGGEEFAVGMKEGYKRVLVMLEEGEQK